MSNFYKLIGAVLWAGILSLILSLCSLPLTFGLLQNQSLADSISPFVCPTNSRLEVKAYHPEPTATNYTCDCLGGDGRVVTTAYISSILIMWMLVAGSVFPFSLLCLFWWINKKRTTQTISITSQAEQDISPSEDKFDKLRALKRMKDADLITTEEYEAKKAEILSKM